MRPYPVERLRSMTRDQAVELSRWARSAPMTQLRARGLTARGWLGAPLELNLREVVRWSEAQQMPRALSGLRDGAFVLLDGVRPAGLFLDPRIASAIIQRTLGADADGVEARGPLGEVERGVLAYAVARWLGEGAFRVGAVFGHAPALLEAVGPTLSWPFDLRLGQSAGAGALWLPPPVGIAPAGTRRAPGWLPLVLSAIAGSATLPASEIASLRVGDVLIPDDLTVDLDGEGQITLALVGGALSLVCANLRQLELLAVQDTLTPPTSGRREYAGADMSDRDDTTEQERLAKLGDTPITLHVEIARVQMSLADVAGLSVGEVLRTGRTLSERVTLRAGDRAVAQGELVDVDGELGVQITDVSE